jgi:glyoxylase-like metal-dependent hydrolase (beta-lactamase superfamily II)
MLEIIPVTACTGAECYLLVSESRGFLVDTGYAFCADVAVRNIARALGDRRLEYILLTHSHYDHVGGLSAVRRAWPEAEVVASIYAENVFARSGARNMIRSMDDKAAAKCGKPAAREDFTADLIVGRVVKEGDVLTAGDTSISVMETPGHTKCSLSYYFREDDLLVLSESAGTRHGSNTAASAFIVSYRDSVETIKRAQSMAPRRILISHAGPESGDDAAQYLKDALAATETAAEWILAEHGLGKSVDEIARAYVAEFYEKRADKYPISEASVMNTLAMIPRLIEESESER